MPLYNSNRHCDKQIYVMILIKSRQQHRNRIHTNNRLLQNKNPFICIACVRNITCSVFTFIYALQAYILLARNIICMVCCRFVHLYNDDFDVVSAAELKSFYLALESTEPQLMVAASETPRLASSCHMLGVPSLAFSPPLTARHHHFLQ